MKSGILIVVVAFGIMSYAGTSEKEFKDTRPIVLMDKKDVKIAPNLHTRGMSAEVLSDKLENAISKLGVYRVITKQSMGRSIEEGSVFAALSEGGEKLAQIKTPAYRMELSVAQYGAEVREKREHTYEYDANYNKVKVEHHLVADRVNAEIFVKMIDMKSTETVLNKQYEQTFETKFRAANERRNMPNVKLLDDLVDKLIERFVTDFVRMQNFSVLSCSESGEILVDVPSTLAKAGSELVLVSRGNATRSRRTGRVSYNEKTVATLVVKTVSEDTCTAEFKKVTEVNANWENVVVRVLSLK